MLLISRLGAAHDRKALHRNEADRCRGTMQPASPTWPHQVFLLHKLHGYPASFAKSKMDFGLD